MFLPVWRCDNGEEMTSENEELNNRLKNRAHRERVARKQAEELLEQKSRELYVKNQELKSLAASLEMARDEAIRANKLKSEFLATISHEIRTPMNGIIGMASVLEYTELNEEQVECIQTIKASSELLLRIVNDILDFSRIEARTVELANEPFNLHQAVKETVDLFKTEASQKGIELVCNLDSQVPDYQLGDQVRFKQVLNNLLSNAIKFTSEGEVVLTVQAQLMDDNRFRLDIEVYDTGIGIPEERFEELFDMFTQVDGSNTREYGGTGLGLAITKQLVELMGGTIEVASEVGVGTTFRLTTMATSIAL